MKKRDFKLTVLEMTGCGTCNSLAVMNISWHTEGAYRKGEIIPARRKPDGDLGYIILIN